MASVLRAIRAPVIYLKCAVIFKSAAHTTMPEAIQDSNACLFSRHNFTSYPLISAPSRIAVKFTHYPIVEVVNNASMEKRAFWAVRFFDGEM